MGPTLIWILPMEFPSQLVAVRKRRGLTQQALADDVGLHVNQIKRYETGTSQPTLETLVRLAKALHVTLDELVFAEGERGPDASLRMQFEALSGFSEEEKKMAKELLDILILKHAANRLSAGDAA